MMGISDTIEKCIQPVRMPHPWVMFEHSLRSTGKKVLTLQQCSSIGKKFGIESEGELVIALVFLSN